MSGRNYQIAAAYIRVSTEDQAEYSPDAQLVEIRKYAAAHGYIIPNEFVFLDEGISGKHTGKRQAFQQMIGLAKTKPKPFDAVLLWKFSRFARNREDSIVYKSMLRRQLGIEVISISEPLTDDKTSILMEAIIEAMDEYYSINLAEEVKRGMTEKARRGGLQSTPPFGYRVEHNVLVPVPEEAALVQSIFQRFRDGEGLFPLAKWLNSLGAKTARWSTSSATRPTSESCGGIPPDEPAGILPTRTSSSRTPSTSRSSHRSCGTPCRPGWPRSKRSTNTTAGPCPRTGTG